MSYPSINITAQPQNWSGKDGDQITISVAATGNGLTYQWFYLKNGKWAVAADTDATYDILTMAPKFENRQVRCKITDATGYSIYSDIATITYAAAPVSPIIIKEQPQNWVGSDGETVTITCRGVGTAVRYQWYYFKESKNKWIASDVKSSTYTLEMAPSFNGRRVKCKLTDAHGNEIFTDEATISYPSVILAQ
jgi:hypothetical protein